MKSGRIKNKMEAKQQRTEKVRDYFRMRISLNPYVNANLTRTGAEIILSLGLSEDKSLSDFPLFETIGGLSLHSGLEYNEILNNLNPLRDKNWISVMGGRFYQDIVEDCRMALEKIKGEVSPQESLYLRLTRTGRELYGSISKNADRPNP